MNTYTIEVTNSTTKKTESITIKETSLETARNMVARQISSYSESVNGYLQIQDMYDDYHFFRLAVVTEIYIYDRKEVSDIEELVLGFE